MIDQRPTPIGFVGLGNIGAPASVNLLGAGFDVIGFDPRPCEPFLAAGGRQAESLADLAGCEVIIQSLPTAEALDATITALLPRLARGAVVADISSYPLAIKRTQAERVAATGAVMLDCEISGLPFQVADRTAVLFAAGDHDAVERCTPAFGTFSARCFFLGGFGAATKLKLIANYMVCAHNLVGAEALNLARRAGLDPEQVVEVLKPSAAGSTTFANKAALMLSREFDAGRGPFSHMFGYLDRAAQLAHDSGVAGGAPLLNRTREVYSIARDQGRGSQDIAAIIEVIEQLAAREDA